MHIKLPHKYFLSTGASELDVKSYHLFRNLNVDEEDGQGLW